MNIETKQMLTANIVLDVYCIILAMIPIIYLLGGKRYRQRLNLYFLGIAVSNVCMTFGGGKRLLLYCFGLCAVFFFLLYHHAYAAEGQDKKDVPFVRDRGVRGADRVCASKPLYRFFLLCDR